MLLTTSEQMRSIDRRTIKEFRISAYSLMERAGFAVAQTAIQMLGATCRKRVEILCGKGNNGGDGFVVGRLLTMQGADVRCILLGDRSAVEGASRTQMDLAENGGARIVQINEDSELDLLPGTDLIIDAILGTGLKGPATGLAACAIQKANEHSSPILSVDIPSGLLPNSMPPNRADMESWSCIKADRTVTIGLMKVELATYPGRDWAGRVDVADIGFPKEAIDAEALWLSMPSLAEMADILPRRAQDVHKGSVGRIAIIAGSPGMTGAATLASEASMRAGAGVTILGAPASLQDILSTKLTEVMVRALPETAERCLSLDAAGPIEKLISWSDVTAIGPGLSTNDATSRLIRKIVASSTQPMVIDADGLNACAEDREALSNRRAPTVITPHVGELSRLTGLSSDQIAKDRICAARNAAHSFGAVVVLKGAGTVVSSQDGRVSINPTGNSGMATAGVGDVLTGIIAGVMAQGLDAFEAAILGVYLHGLSGDLSAATIGPHSLLARDLIQNLPEAIKKVSKECLRD
ncbi:MAG: NAD(P)H-hydrate dehydratase [Candidatus Latescibacteria bacterium]|nr:NAD(P)H-hydrate dehydratase [Candidatus Latescibacterota bacterium]